MGGDEGRESNEKGEEGDEGEQDREGQAREDCCVQRRQGEDQERHDKGQAREEQGRQDRLEGGFGFFEEEVRRQQGAGLGESMLEGQEGTQYQGLRSFRRQDCGRQGLACQMPGHLQGRLSFFAYESGTTLHSSSVVPVPRARRLLTLL